MPINYFANLANPIRLLPKSNLVYTVAMNASPKIQNGPAGGGMSTPIKPDMQLVAPLLVTFELIN